MKHEKDDDVDMLPPTTAAAAHTRRDWIDDDSFACPTDRRDDMALECFVKSSESQIVDIRAGHDLCCPHKHILKICKTFTLSFGESFLIYLLVSGSPLLLHYSIVVVHGHHPALVPLLNVQLGWMVSLCEALSCPVHGSNVKAERARNFIRIVTTNIYWQTRNLFFCCTWTGSFGQDSTGQDNSRSTKFPWNLFTLIHPSDLQVILIMRDLAWV